jgi:hypothetical protein
MNERLRHLANEAALYANQNSGNDCFQGHYWTTLFSDKYTELLVKDLGTFFNKDMPARLAYELVQRNYNV